MSVEQGGATPAAAATGVRRRPVQRRGQATMDAILDAGLELLGERGLEGFTTNAIAQRAGINIATLYGYFADKQAILYELSARYERQRAEYLSQLPPWFEQAEDWRDVATTTIEQLAQLRRATPGSVSLRQVIVAMPELRHLDVERDRQVTEHLAAALLMIRPDLDPAEARRAAAPVVIAGAHVLDRACEGEELDEELLSAFCDMTIAHLERVLG
jgi:AcrR family transcriptional regulator